MQLLHLLYLRLFSIWYFVSLFLVTQIGASLLNLRTLVLYQPSALCGSD